MDAIEVESGWEGKDNEVRWLLYVTSSFPSNMGAQRLQGTAQLPWLPTTHQYDRYLYEC